MGSGKFSSVDYTAGVDRLADTGTIFARSAAAARTGDYGNVSELLDPRKLKNGLRESCYPPGVDSLLPIITVLDLTGSMKQVPHHLQRELANLLELIVEQGIAEHPNIMFIGHDDEHCVVRGGLQMSQFEIEAPKLIEALNDMIITHQGGGNQGEAYHLAFYAIANHTRLESFEREQEKGICAFVCDEPPYYDNLDPAQHGTKPALAQEVFGDVLQAEVTMLDSVKAVAERYHIIVIRPGHTCHGRDKGITRQWQELLAKADANPQLVLEVEQTEEIVSSMALAIGQIMGHSQDELVDVLTAKGAAGVKGAAKATALVPVGAGAVAKASASSALATADDPGVKGRKRLEV